jgi:2-octaprenyl-6-methoxyphenol hydroxylase
MNVSEHGHGRFDVAIAGGGFAGLSLALALSQALAGQARILVVDAGDPGSADGDPRASALSAGSIHLLDVLGVWPKVRDQAQPVEAIDITDSSLSAGVRPIVLSYDNHLEDGTPATVIVSNAPVLAALAAAARSAPGVAVVEGVTAVSFVRSDAVAEIMLSNGQTARAGLIVAADGRRSRLRDDAGIGVVGRDYGQLGIVTTVEHELPHRGRATQHFLPGGPFAILPLPGHRSCVTWSEQRAEAERILRLDDAGFLAELDRRFGGRLGAVRLAGPRRAWPLSVHLARAYVADRFALLGDAAHGVHPIAGQGLNLALRDVAAIAETLAGAARVGLDIGHKSVLEEYERWRRTDSALSAVVFDALNTLFASDNSALRMVRDTGMGLVDRLPGLKRFLVAEAAGLTGEVPRLLRGMPI